MSANVPAAAANAEKKNNAPVAANAGKKNNAANAGKKNNSANAEKKNNAVNAEKKNNAPAVNAAANAEKKNNVVANAANAGDNAPIPRHASVEKIEVSAKKLKELVDKDGTNCAALKEQAKKVIDDSSEVDNALKKDEVKEQNLKSVTTLLKEIIDPIAKACKTNAKAAPAANATAAPAANATATAANATAAPKMEGGRRKTKTRKSKRKGKSRRRM
jgi:hypothetical protein